MTFEQFDGQPQPNEFDGDLHEYANVSIEWTAQFDPPDHWEGGPDLFTVPEGSDLAGYTDEVRLLGGERLAADGGAAAAPRDDAADAPAGPDGAAENANDATWAEVAALYEDQTPGSSTRAANHAATILSEEHDFVAIRETDGIYYYNPRVGYYVRKGMTFLDELVEAELPGHANPGRLRAIRQKVKSRNYMSVESDDPATENFEPPEGKVNLKNGVLDLDAWADDPATALEDHNPEYYFTSRLNVEYDPDAESDFLNDALTTAIPDEGERRKFLEFVGYSLEMWTANREKAMFFVGYSGAGKSTMQEIVDAMFGGPPTKIALAPHQIADEKFDSGRLADASLNTLNDINGGKITDTGTLKRVISGEPTKMEDKMKTPQFGRPKAKHLWTCNWVPRIIGEDDAVWRRFLLIEFTNTIPDSEQEEGYKERLKSDETVRSALLNLALEGRERMDEHGFTNDRSRRETRLLWDKWRDSNKLFLHEQFELTGDEEDKVEKKSYMKAYGEWAARKGLEQHSQQKVSNAFGWVPEIGGTQGDSEHYTGLRWRDQDAAEEPSQNSRVRKVRKYIEAFERPDEAAPIEAVVEHAESNGLDPEKVRSDIQNLLETGQLHEPETGTVRLTEKTGFF